MFNVDNEGKRNISEEIELKTNILSGCKYISNLNLNLNSNFLIKTDNVNKVTFLTNKLSISLLDNNWLVSPSSDDDIKFLIENQ